MICDCDVRMETNPESKVLPSSQTGTNSIVVFHYSLSRCDRAGEITCYQSVDSD